MSSSLGTFGNKQKAPVMQEPPRRGLARVRSPCSQLWWLLSVTTPHSFSTAKSQEEKTIPYFPPGCQLAAPQRSQTTGTSPCGHPEKAEGWGAPAGCRPPHHPAGDFCGEHLHTQTVYEARKDRLLLIMALISTCHGLILKSYWPIKAAFNPGARWQCHSHGCPSSQASAWAWRG